MNLNLEHQQLPIFQKDSALVGHQSQPEATSEEVQYGVTEPSLIQLRDRFADPTVTVYSRHSIKCPHYNEPKFLGCKCRKWINCKGHRFSTKTRSSKHADNLRREIETRLDPIQVELTRLQNLRRPGEVPIREAVELFLSDGRTRKLAPNTQRNHAVTMGKLLAWSESRHLKFLPQLTTLELTTWRSTWKDAPGTSALRRDVLSTFFNFCVRQDWLSRNPARYLSPIRHRRKPTDWFPPNEFEQVLKAAQMLATGLKARRVAVQMRRRLLPLLVLLMRASGLVIRDALFLERNRLTKNKLFLYRSKTGEPVCILLERKLAVALRAIPVGPASDAHHFFWNGQGTVKSVLQAWNDQFRTLFKLAAIKSDGSLKWCHSQMLRDTFAIELLLGGVQIEEVSMLLGHSSIRTTERHYLPWVKARQQKLERSMKKAHLARGITKTKSVRQLLEKLKFENDSPSLFDQSLPA